VLSAAGDEVPPLGASTASAAGPMTRGANTVKRRKLFFICRFYGFCQRNHVCGADH
jgi:hypothetical protein